MNPTSTLRMRRWTAFLAIAWALLAIFLSIAGLRSQPGALSHPFSDSRLGGRAVIEGVAASAAEAGASPGDSVLEVNGVSYLYQQRQGSHWLRAGVPNVYLLEKRDGRRITITLPPVPCAETRAPTESLFHALLLVVAMIYLVTGGAVWWMRPDRAGAWALLLFCSTMAVQLATVIQSDYIPWSFPRLMVNLPLIGATTFHLFTTYPIEPAWVVRHRAHPLLPYALAFALGCSRSRIACSACARGLGSSVALRLSRSGSSWSRSASSALERRRHARRRAARPRRRDACSARW